MHIKTVGNRPTVYLAENDKNAHVSLISVLIENISKFKYGRLWYKDSNKLEKTQLDNSMFWKRKIRL